MEARNLRNMSMAQTPLLGDENTPLHGGSNGIGFGGATPQHKVAYTPNPLATPRYDENDPSATPRNGVSSTPFRTPMRDNLAINPEGFSSVGETPRDRRVQVSSAKQALRAGFKSLPKPENNFELLVPDEETDASPELDPLTEEDAAERDARERRRREAEEKAALARRSQVVQHNLPRPARVDVAGLLQRLSIDEDEGHLASAYQLIHSELAELMLHDSIAHPLPGTSLPGHTTSMYQMPGDDVVALAKEAIQLELATSVGFPHADPEKLRQGLHSLSQSQDVDDSESWAVVRQRLVYDKSSKSWVEPDSISLPERIEGYSAILEEGRELMASTASKTAKVEKKLGVMLGGYMARSQALSKRVSEAFEQIQLAQLEFNSFNRLKTIESAVGPHRVEALKEEVEKLERREKMLQERYAELDTERRDAMSRIAELEEKVMADAEAINEAHLAEMEVEG
jgi:pre-mRNA-splicing factor CDC5/CEF1